MEHSDSTNRTSERGQDEAEEADPEEANILDYLYPA